MLFAVAVEEKEPTTFEDDFPEMSPTPMSDDDLFAGGGGPSRESSELSRERIAIMLTRADESIKGLKESMKEGFKELKEGLEKLASRIETEAQHRQAFDGDLRTTRGSLLDIERRVAKLEVGLEKATTDLSAKINSGLEALNKLITETTKTTTEVMSKNYKDTDERQKKLENWQNRVIGYCTACGAAGTIIGYFLNRYVLK